MAKWLKVFDDGRYRIFASEDSIAYHFKNENNRWRSGKFRVEDHNRIVNLLSSIVEQLIQNNNEVGRID